MTTAAERVASVLLLVIPAVSGIVTGILSLRRKEPRPWIAITGINASFAIFNVLALAIAG